MPALMPRCTECVLCGDAIQGKGRIDRIYCSASCRTLAWRARSGDRWAGRRKCRPPQPGSYVARSALPLLAVRMKAELTDAKRHSAKLEHDSDGAGGAAVTAAGAGVAAAGAVGLLMMLQKKLGRSHRAALDRVRAELEAEQVRQHAERAAEREQAACRQADLERQVARLHHRAEQASFHQQEAEQSKAELEQAVASLRHRQDDDAKELRAMQTEVARWRQIALQACAESQAHKTALLEESQKRKRILADFEKEVRETIEERTQWQAAQRKLEIEAYVMTEHLGEEARQHRTQLAALSSRAETAEAELARLRVDAKKQERLFQKRIEQIQIEAANQKVEPRRDSQREQPALPPKKKPKSLPAPKKKREPKSLPAKSGVLETIKLVTLGAAGATAAIGGAMLLGGTDRKRLPPKEVGTYLEVTPVPERKRLPPKSD